MRNIPFCSYRVFGGVVNICVITMCYAYTNEDKVRHHWERKGCYLCEFQWKLIPELDHTLRNYHLLHIPTLYYLGKHINTS